MGRRLEDKLDSIDRRLSDIDTTLAAQHEALKDHIRRTELLESKVEPIEDHVSTMKAWTKLIGAAVLGALLKFIHGIWH